MAGILAVELGPRGILAVNVEPGYVHTERQVANAAANGLEGHYVGAPPSVPASVIAWLATTPDAGHLQRADREGPETGTRARPPSGLASAPVSPVVQGRPAGLVTVRITDRVAVLTGADPVFWGHRQE